MFNLKDKIAFITGATQYLGRDMANTLAQHGANIVLTSRDEGKAIIAAKEISERYGVKTLGLAMNVTEPDSIESATLKAIEDMGRIDILINNAGGGSGASEGNLLLRDYGDIAAMINTNLTGTIFVCKAVAKYMVKQNGGRIINLASVAALVGRDRTMYRKSAKMEQPVDYAAAKGGVISLTRDLAGLLCEYNINVNSISPGGFYKEDLPTEFVNLYSDETMQRRMGKMGTDINGTALFLASDASDYITGQNIVVDGGFSVWK